MLIFLFRAHIWITVQNILEQIMICVSHHTNVLQIIHTIVHIEVTHRIKDVSVQDIQTVTVLGYKVEDLDPCDAAFLLCIF